ncbi:MAG: hypothetical protein IKW30_04650 [Lachnospiraceae bacterium]|nr:hypothetical protein [Lachnospiraceae bacterium]
MECEPYIVLDEISPYLEFSYESSDSSITNGFSGSDFHKNLTYKTGIINKNVKSDASVSNENPSETTEAADTATNTEQIVADTSEYKYWQMGDPMLEFTNKTIVTNNDPNYIIIKNGPGPIVKSSYPYIKTFYGYCSAEKYIYSLDATLTIHSTDYYGCPYEFTINGVDYKFEARHYVITHPEDDRSEWNCYLTNDSDSLGCYVTIVENDYIRMDGTFIQASFYADF